MIGEGGVAAVLGRAPEHMTGHAIVRWTGIRLHQSRAVTGQAARSIVLLRLGGLFVGVVTGAAPHLRPAADGADAAGELLGVAYHLENRAGVDVYGEYLFQLLAGLEVAEMAAGVFNARLPPKWHCSQILSRARAESLRGLMMFAVEGRRTWASAAPWQRSQEIPSSVNGGS